MNFASKALALALAVTLTAPAVAQTADPATDPAMTYPAPVENDDDFPWGLLGLLGLAGLLGLKRRDRDDVRRTPGTGTGNTNR
jgi:MYXO-CTERM domain-containing protein